MYVCLYHKKNDVGTTGVHYEVFEDVETMIKVLETISPEVIGPILTFQTESAFVYYRK
jgi:hypothetical protein